MTVLAEPALFSATRCSTFSSRSTREKAYTPGPPSAYSSICAPVDSAGVELRSVASSLMSGYSCAPVSKWSPDP